MSVDSPAAPSQRVAVVTLGCGRNDVDSSQLAGAMTSAGHTMADADDADVIIINTCTFVDEAKQESIDVILEAVDRKNEGHAKAVVVSGCMAQRYGDELADELPDVDAVVAFSGYQDIAGVVSQAAAGTLPSRVVGAPSPKPEESPRKALPIATVGHAQARGRDFEMARKALLTGLEVNATLTEASGPIFPQRVLDGAPWAYVKIASGCDRICTFCSIPSFRGGFISRPVRELVAEATWLAESGVRELVLVSENTTSYGKDMGGRAELSDLLQKLSDIDGIDRIRLQYLQPDEITTDLIDTMIGLDAVANYFDLPFQHASADVLRRMARGGSLETFAELVRSIRSKAPDASLRSNFIVGFPGETDADAQALETFFLDTPIDFAGLFTWSAQEGTAAAHMDDVVDPAVVRDRHMHLAGIADRMMDAQAAAWVGKDLEVLVTADGLGRSHREGPESDGEVLIDGPVSVGDLVRLTVTGTDGVDLVATAENVANTEAETKA